MIRGTPLETEERVVKYTEFAAQFGPDLNLDMYGRHLNFLQFYCLDIIIPAILLVFVALFLGHEFESPFQSLSHCIYP